MGVTELLKQLRSKQRNVQLYELLRDKDVGIDASVWLHMYVSVQHEEVSKGNFTSIVQGFIGRLKKLKTWGARPIVVFDGVSNEIKASTNSARSNKRDRMVQGLMEDLQACLNAGEEPSTALMEKISKANAGVTRDLVYAVIRQLRVEGYPYVVAPYEADHTLVALLHEGSIQYIISVDSDMLVHHGGNVVVIPPGFWQDGLGILYDPAANTAPEDESNALCDRPRDLGLIIDRVVGHHACEPREAAAAVCLAYALLVDSDYHNLKGVGAKTALSVMELLLHRGVTLESWKDPDQLADILCNNYAKQLRKEDVVSDMKRAKGGLLGGIALHLAKREINYLDEKVAIDTGCIERFGKTSFDREQVDLISLGLLCMRDGCGCQRKKPKHHDVGQGYSVIQPQDTVHPVQLTEDLIIGAKMCEEHVDTASLAQLARWLRTRGQFASGKKKHELRASVRAQMAAEAAAKKGNHQLTNLRCPEGLSVLQLLRNCGRNVDLPLIDNAEAKAALAAIPSDRWITYIGELQERAPLVSEQFLQKHFKDVCTKKGVFRKGYKRICFRTHLRGFAAYFVPNGDKPAKECWFRLHCPRSMVNATYPVFVRCSIEWHEAMDGRPPYVTNVCDQMCACPAARVDQGCVHVCALLQAVQNLRRRDPRDNCPTSKRCEWNTARAKVEEDLVNNEISYLVFEKADPSQQEQRKKHNPVCMSNDLGHGAYDPCPPAVVNSVLRDLQMREKSTLIPKIFKLIEVCAQGTEQGEKGMSVMYTKEHAAKTRYDLWYNYATAELQRTGLDKVSTELSEAWESELCADDAEADSNQDNDESF